MSRICLPLSVSATLLASTALADVPNVAADIAPVHALVSRVMQDVGTPSLVIPAGASPHEYNLRPSEASSLQEADVVFWVGEDLSPWLESAIETLASNASVTELLEADGTELLDFRESALFEAHVHGAGEHDDHGHDDHDHDKAEDHDHDHDHASADEHDHDHAHDEAHAGHGDEDHDHDHDHASADEHDHDHAHDEEHAGHDDEDHENEAHEDHAHDHDDHGHDDHAGHDHGEHDPHAWLSIANAKTWLDLIAGQLSAADPENAGAYFANAAAGKAEMDALKEEITALLAPAAGGNFIVFHDAYQYFENTFDFPASGAISLGDAQDPSPARIAEIQGRIQNEGIDCVLAEPQYNPGLVATVMEGTPAKTGVIDPLGSNLSLGADLYPQLLRNMATVLSECLTSES